MMQREEADFDSEDDCKIPLIVFSPPNHAEDTEPIEERPNNTEASGGPSSTPDGKKEQREQSDFDDDDQCKIPMTVFWSSIQEENATPKTDEKECDNDCETFHPTDAMSFAWQTARGMSYLSEKGLVHRDLAARNILVGHSKKLKIGDFGLMREMYHELYKVKKQRKLPIKWMAPEAIHEQIFTSKSDVWSYGVVMWEIATLGGSPYPLLNNAEVMNLLRTGHRMEKPDLCSDNFYAFMMECWKQNPDERPSFQELVERLERTMTEHVEYLDLKQLDETKAYYQVQESKTGEIGGDSGLEQRAVSSISIAV
ncbi:proto-oncogene tyrosine-protein kinase receptor Ret-like [Porites lutea]|uniref:proto-oncogene tyrosine-protein kinase receptor Ret-like n=1 Tax=Porites lutea TaxID=51062 RepID=UPI003CC5B00D